MIYIDSSSLLKLLWEEPESQAVREAVAREEQVAVSTLTELEIEVQLRAKRLGTAITKARYDAYRATLQSFKSTAPFEFHDLPGAVFRRAIQQHLSSRIRHCRSLDRLHLASMAELGLTRLMTNDAKQAGTAKALGYHVVHPAIAIE